MTDNTITNCPKCGNPLTPGTTVCPVCGTPVGMQTPSSPANNVEGQAQSTPVAPVNNVGVQARTISPIIQPTAPAIEPTPVQPLQPTNDVVPIAQGAPVQPTPAATIDALAPTIQPTVQPTVIPSAVPTSTPTVTPGVVQSQPETKKGKMKVKLNNKTLIIILVAFLIICGVFIFLKDKGGTKKVTNKPTTAVETVEQKDVVANGFRFKVENDWIVQSNSDNTVVTNSNGTVVVKLESYSFNLASIDKDKLQANFNDLGNEYNPNKVIVSDVNITENKIASKDGYLVNAKVTEDDSKQYAAQYYFINGGSDFTIGATVVYSTEEAKTNNEGKITSLLNSMSYVNDTNSIITLINKNYRAFSVYFNAINGVVLQIPTQEEPAPEGEVQSPVE